MPFQSFFEWYHPSVKQVDFAYSLLKSKEDGSFLVHPHFTDLSVIKYQITYKQDGINKSIPIVKDSNGNLLIQHTVMAFKTLNNLVEYYWSKEGRPNVSMKFPLIHAVPYALFKYPSFYHGCLTKNEAEQLLKVDGTRTFLLRDSTSQSVQLTLSSYTYCKENPFSHTKLNLQYMLMYFEQLGIYVFNDRSVKDYIMKCTVDGKENYYSEYLPVNRSEDNQDYNLPPEILRMDKKSIDLFKQALREGKNKCHNIRLIIIGHFGAGKTKLARRIIGDDFDITTVRSTNGVDIFIINCCIEADGSWKIEEERNVEDVHIQRMSNALRNFKVPKEGENERERFYVQQLDNAYDKTTSIESEGEITGLEVTDKKPLNFTIPSSEYASSSDMPSLDHQDDYREFNPPNTASDRIFATTDGEMYSDFETVREKLTEEDFEMTVDLEKVVQICHSPLQKDIARLSIWDFAGQAIFYTTHLAFLSRRAQYLLVTDVSRSLTETVEDDDFSIIGGKQKLTISDFVKFWINVIYSIASITSRGSPKVFLAATHKDRLKYIPEINDTIIQEHFKSLRQLFHGNPARLHLFEENFCIDCTNQHDPDISYLRKKIFNVAVQEKHWGEEIPLSWMFLERKLRKEKQDGKRVLTVEDVKIINRTLSVSISDEDQIILFLRFQHEIGEVLFFLEEDLTDIVILDPQWLIDSFKCIITAKDFVGKSESELRTLWKSLYEGAILEPELIDAVWEKQKDQKFMNHKEYLLLLLENTGIIAKPKAYYVDGKEKEEKFYLVPCMLNEEPPKTIERLVESSSVSIHPLWFVFCHEFLPPPIFFRLLACCIKRFQIAKFNSSIMLFTKVAIFRVSEEHSFILEHRGNAIRLQIIGTDEFVPNSLSCGLKRFMFENLSGITDVFSPQDTASGQQKQFHFSLGIQCSDSCVPCLISNGQMPNTAIILPEFEGNTLDAKPTYQELGRIARRIGAEFYELGITLGLQKYQIDQIKLTFCDNPVDVNFQILKKWVEIEIFQNCSFGTLQRAMEEVGIDVSFLPRVHTISTKESLVLSRNFLDMIPSDEQIDQMALRVGTAYQQLAIELGLGPETLDHIKMDKKNTLDRVTQILKAWRNDHSVNATFFHLCNAMLEVTMDISILKQLSSRK